MNRGEDASDFESVFPPHAPTVIGALRAALAREQGWTGRRDWPAEIKAVLGDGFDDLGRLSFVGPFLSHKDRVLFPMPRHIVGRISSEDHTFTPAGWLRPSDARVLCDLGEVYLPVSPVGTRVDEKPPLPGDGYFITASGMEKVLAGRLPGPEDCIHRSRLFCLEPRVGIQRDDEARVTREGALYSPHFVRLKQDVAMLVGITGLPNGWELPGLFPLGGESRMARCAGAKPVNLPGRSRADVLVLVTPGIFSGGPWYGAGPGDPSNRLHKSLTAEVKTMAMDRPLAIGGWDTLQGQPLPSTPFVAPGAVWWLEAPGSSRASPVPLGSKTSHGFGLALGGKAPD